MSFQIHDKEGKAITLTKLDVEASEFWNKELNSRSYATPNDRLTSLSWFDSIGYNIHNPNVKYTSGWNNVKCSMLSVQTQEYGMLPLEKQLEKLKFANEYLKPYFELIDYWESLGYTPMKVE